MRRRIVIAMLALGLALLPAACTLSMPTAPSPTAPESSATPAAAPVASAPEATVAAPAEMPTAAPLWTATPVIAAAATQPTNSAGTPAAAPLAQDVVATVNGVPLARAEWERQVSQAESYLLQQPGTDLTTDAGKEALRVVQEQVLDWMIDQVLIEQAATQAGVTVSPQDVDAQIDAMRGGDAARFDSWLSANGLTLELLQQQVRADLMTAAMRDRVTAQIPRQVEQFHVRHILASDEARAQAALARLRGGENFIVVARETTEDDTTRNSGGDLGFLPRGVMPPAFEASAYALQPGQVSEVVSSEFGFHIIQLVEIDPLLEVPDELWPVVQQRGFDDWLAAQRAAAAIQRGI